MMKTFRLCLAFSILCGVYSSAPALAQTADTTSAWRYFPLEVGNEWRFAGEFFGESYFNRLSITSETTLDDTTYFRLASQETNAEGTPTGSPYVKYIRFDVPTTELRLQGEEPFPPLGLVVHCPLGADFGAAITCNGFCATGVSGAYGQRVAIRDDSVVTTVKTFDTSHCESINYLAAGIGPVRIITNAGSMQLHYARIGGVEYGEQFPVAVETTTSERATLALAAYPNPSRDDATVRFALDVPQRVTLAVYDVLGRRMLTADLGAQPAGEATHRLELVALPAGLYVVRLTGDAGASATARIVRH